MYGVTERGRAELETHLPSSWFFHSRAQHIYKTPSKALYIYLKMARCYHYDVKIMIEVKCWFFLGGGGGSGAIQIRCEPCFGHVMEARLFKSSFCIQFGSFLMPCWHRAKWTQLDLGVFPGKTPRQRRWTHTKHLTHILMLTAHGSTLCMCCVIVD